MINWVCDLPVKIYRLISFVFALSTVTLFISALPALSVPVLAQLREKTSKGVFSVLAPI